MNKHILKRTIIFVVSILAIIALTVTLTGESAATIASGKVTKILPVYSVERDDNKISITFDCAWGVEHTDSILGEMDKFGVKCTFFAVEFWVNKYPDYAKKIVEAGHELQTHSSTHSHMSKMSVEAIESELLSSSKAIESVTGQKVSLFRCPFGEYDNDVISTARRLELQVVQWDVDSLDWKDLSSRDIAERIIARVTSGSIILCHNNGLHTAEALPLIFAALQQKGYEFVRVSDLLYKDNFAIDSNGRQIPQ